MFVTERGMGVMLSKEALSSQTLRSCTSRMSGSVAAKPQYSHHEQQPAFPIITYSTVQ